MIFFEGDENKKNLLFFLVAFFMLFIVFQWTGHNPIKKISRENSDNQYWDEVGKTISDTGKVFEYNFEKAKIELKQKQADAQIEFQREILLEDTKEFLENKKNVTSTNTTSTE